MKVLTLKAKHLVLFVFLFMCFGCSNNLQLHNVKSIEGERFSLDHKKKTIYSKIKKKIKSYLASEKFDQALLFLSSYTNQEIADFYEKEGSSILNWTFMIRSSSPFDFIIKNIPLKFNCDIIAKENYKIISSFLNVWSQMESKGNLDEEEKKFATDILRILLNIPLEFRVYEAIERIVSEEEITEGVKKCLELAKSHDLVK